MTEQELRVKSLELSLQIFALYPEESRIATIEEDLHGKKSIAKRSLEIAEHFYTFLTATRRAE
jgi:hypothetical protein